MINVSAETVKKRRDNLWDRFVLSRVFSKNERHWSIIPQPSSITSHVHRFSNIVKKNESVVRLHETYIVELNYTN